jgi:hypothetical protein
VEHGLKVTQIHQVVEYTPATCFQKFREQVSEARRAGDADPNKKIIAETNKLDGNSSYGKTVYALSMSMLQYWKSERSTNTSMKSK